MHHMHLLLERVFNVPHLCTDAKLSTILAVISNRANLMLEVPDALFSTGDEKRDMERLGPMTIENGVAVIPARGTFARRVGGLRPSSGMVGYNQIADMADMAMADKSVRRVVLNIDSHGGEGTGAMELHDYISSMRGRKPITAVVGSNALSAGYLLACAADEIVVPALSNVGSIGVVMAHHDESALLAKEGVKVTYIYAGAHKIDGASTAPLSDGAKAEAQKRVDAMYNAFAERVARARGLSIEAVKNTEALIYSGTDAISKSLADRVANERETLHSFTKPQALTVTVPSVSL